MTINNLDDIERRLAALPPRPWKVEGETFNEDSEPRLAAWALEDANGLFIWSSGGGEYAHPDLATGMFIAGAPKLIERLVAEVRWLRGAPDEKEGDMHLRIRRGYDKTVADTWRAYAAKIEKERDEAKAEVERLTAERGNAVVLIDPATSNNPNLQSSFDSFIRSMRADLENDLLRAVNQRFSVNDAELRTERDAAFRRGANAMREAAAQALSTQGNGYYGLTGSGVAKTIRALPMPEDKS